VPSVSFSSASSSRCSNSSPGTGGRCVANGAGPSCCPPPPRSKIDACPRIASSCAFWPEACACGSTSSIPLRVSPVESNAPHLIRHSIARLLTARASTRSQKSQIDSKGPSASRLSRIASTAW